MGEASKCCYRDPLQGSLGWGTQKSLGRSGKVGSSLRAKIYFARGRGIFYFPSKRPQQSRPFAVVFSPQIAQGGFLTYWHRHELVNQACQPTPWLCPFRTLRPWASDSASLSCSFPACEMGKITPTAKLSTGAETSSRRISIHF